MREIPESKVYSDLDDRTKDKFERFDDMTGKSIQGLDKLAEKANNLLELKKFGDNSELNDILNALVFFVVNFFSLMVFNGKFRMSIRSWASCMLDTTNWLWKLRRPGTS
jgi:hypothetical protein